MKVSVWDTYVKREGSKIMHFDILVPSELKDEKIIFGYGKEFLKSKSFHIGELSSKECKFCHIEHLPILLQLWKGHGQPKVVLAGEVNIPY